ncbi:MAG: hypothetical protein ACX936_21095 [Marinobacter sp.]
MSEVAKFCFILFHTEQLASDGYSGMTIKRRGILYPVIGAGGYPALSGASEGALLEHTGSTDVEDTGSGGLVDVTFAHPQDDSSARGHGNVAFMSRYSDNRAEQDFTFSVGAMSNSFASAGNISGALPESMGTQGVASVATGAAMDTDMTSSMPDFVAPGPSFPSYAFYSRPAPQGLVGCGTSAHTSAGSIEQLVSMTREFVASANDSLVKLTQHQLQMDMSFRAVLQDASLQLEALTTEVVELRRRCEEVASAPSGDEYIAQPSLLSESALALEVKLGAKRHRSAV